MTGKTTRLIAPNGSTVEVSREKAERLISQGFAMPRGFHPAEDGKPRTAAEGNAAKKPTTTPPRRPSRTEE